MQIFYKDGVVVATHADASALAADAYGAEISVMTVPDGTVLLPIGTAPSDGPDHRQLAVPILALADIKTAAVAEVAAYANSISNNLTAGIPQAELLSYGAKEAAARAYVAKTTLTSTQNALLQSEAQMSGLSEDDLCAKIIAKADYFARVAGLIAGVRSAAEAAIAAAPDAAGVAAALAAAKKQADSALASLNAGS